MVDVAADEAVFVEMREKTLRRSLRFHIQLLVGTIEPVMRDQ